MENNPRTWHLQGKMSESFIKGKLREEGFIVRKLVKQGYNFIYLDEPAIESILRKAFTFFQIFKKKALYNFFNKNRIGLPDFICFKDGKISFVEVKSNSSKLSEKQLNIFRQLQSMGYSVSIRRVRVNFTMEEV